MTELAEMKAPTKSPLQEVLAQHASQASAGRMLTGTIRAFLTAQEASVETRDGARLHAVQAASCLLAPAIGDRVLAYVDRSEAFVLAVLERSSEHAAEIAIPGADKIVLKSENGLELNARKLNITAREVNVITRALSQTGTVLANSFTRILETVVDKTIGARTITTRAQARTAVVQEVETLSAGTLVQNIENVATQNSEIALVTATQDVRLDAKRVSVG